MVKRCDTYIGSEVPDGEYLVLLTDYESRERECNALREALAGLKRGECFCEMAIGNPMYKEHSKQCVKATAALAKEST